MMLNKRLIAIKVLVFTKVLLPAKLKIRGVKYKKGKTPVFPFRLVAFSGFGPQLEAGPRRILRSNSSKIW